MDIDRLKFKPDKFCGICGDKALGYNFNAITCEACKAFFRRNALRSKDFKCPFDGNCKIDLVTRRFCQKCRLKKCFDIGMKKEWILSDEEKKIKRDKIIENRKKKESNVNGFNGGNGCSSGIMMHSQLSNTSDNTTSSSTNNGPTLLTKSNDCLTIDNDGFMISSVINASVCPTLTFPSSCYPANDDDGHNHHDLNNQNDRNRNNRSHMNHPVNHNNVDKEFLNSIYLLEQQQHQHKNTNPNNNYLSNKFFPVKESSSSSITDDCSPSPPIIHHSTNSSISPLPSTTPSSNISSSSSLQSSYIKPTLYNNTDVAACNNDNLHLSGHLSSLLLNNNNNIDLPPSSKTHHNHNHHNHLLNNHHQNDDPNTNDYLDCKPNINMIKHLSNSHSHSVQPYPNPTTTNTTPLGLGHHIDSSTPSSSSLSYPIVQKLTFKTEPIQEEIVVCRSSTRQQPHQNEFGLAFQPTPHQSHPSHRGVGCSDIPAINFGNNHINGRINQNRILMPDQSSRISSDESQTTVYNSYNSDQINYDDTIGLERTVPITNNNNNNNNSKHTSLEDETKNSVAQLVNIENEQSFNKMNMEDNHHLNNHQIENDLKTSKQSSTNSTSIILQDIASLPFGPKSIGYNFVEIIRMEELTYACGHLQNWYHHGPILNEIHHLAEIYQIAEQVIHHFISMAKMINSFCELCETDQISLLKYSVTELIILRSVPCFLSNKDAWIFNLKRNEKGTILKFKTCKSQIPASEFNDDIKRFIMSIPDTCKNDQSLFDLATMVILFNPNRLELKHKEIIKLEYMTYRHLLSKYINVNYSSSSTSSSTQESKNNRIFSETILNIIDRLRKVNDKIKNRLSFKVIEEYKAKLTHL